MLKLNIGSSKTVKPEKVLIDLDVKNTHKYPSSFGEYVESNSHKNELKKIDNIKVENKINNIVELDLHIHELLEKKHTPNLEKSTSYSANIKLFKIQWFINICMRVFSVNQFNWLKRRRLLQAKALLINTEQSLEEIAREVGYQNVAEFSVAFRKEFNLSPYQQRNLAEIGIN